MKKTIEVPKFKEITIDYGPDLVIIHRNIDGAVVINDYDTIKDFETEWLDDDKCISIGDEFICGVYKGNGYIGFSTVEDFCLAFPDLHEIVKF